MLNDVEAVCRPEGMEQEGFAPVEPWSSRSFVSHTSLSLLTSFGSFDVWLRPDGSDGYDDLIRRAVDIEIGEATVKAVHLEDSIRIKRAIGGPKCLSQLPLLREVQEERGRRGLD